MFRCPHSLRRPLCGLQLPAELVIGLVVGALALLAGGVRTNLWSYMIRLRNIACDRRGYWATWAGAQSCLQSC